MQTTFTLADHEKDSVIQNADVSYTDGDMNRNADQQEEDALVGEIAELVMNKFFLDNGISFQEPDTYKYDVEANGSAVEVKGRKTWNFSDPDLLVRTKFDLAADVYVQIDLHTTDGDYLNTDLSNLGEVEILGFATREDVENNGEPFNQHLSEKENDTLIIEREDLRNPNNLENHL